jgi:hypothetical protein
MPSRQRVFLLFMVTALAMAFVPAADASVSPLRAFGRGVSPVVPGFANCTTSCLTGSSSPAEGGTFNTTKAMTFDASGRLLVVNSNFNRIDRFVRDSTTGDWAYDRGFGWNVNSTGGTTAFENCTGTNCDNVGTASGDAGGLRSPSGIAVDSQGRIYVADDSNYRVSRYTVDPTTGVVSFDRAFGFGVSTGAATFQNCTSSCQRGYGISTGGAGQMKVPTSVAIDSADRIWVSDAALYRVQVFTSDPTTGVVSFERGFGVGVQTGAAQFENCTTVTTCQSGVYASRAIGGGFAFPTAIAFDPQGQLVVADSSGYRYTRFSAYAGSGDVQFDRTWGWGVATGAAALQTCTVSANCQLGVASAAAGASEPWGLAIDANGRIWGSDQGNNRVVQYSIDGSGNAVWGLAFGAGVATGASAFETCTTTCQAASTWSGAGAVRVPSGLAIDAQQQIFVGSQFLSRVNSFSVQVVPGAPLSVSAVPSETTAAVTWAAPTANGGPAVTAYTVTATPGGATCTATPPTTTCTVSGLTAGTAYAFAVTATNSVGTGPSATTTATTTGGASSTTTAVPADATAGGSSTRTTVAKPIVVSTTQLGATTLAVRVRGSGAGTLRVSGTRLARSLGVGGIVCTGSRSITAAATVVVACRLTTAARATLAHMPLRVRLTTTFTVKGGGSASTSRTVRLKQVAPAPTPTPSVVTG